MTTHIGKRLAAAFAVSFLLLFVNGFIAFRSLNTLITNNNLVIQTQDILETTEAIRSSVLNAETGQRGYLLTGEERFLEPYNLAISEMPGQIAELKLLTSADPQSAGSIEDLENAIRLRIEKLESDMVIRGRDGLSPLLATDSLDRGKVLMDEVRRRIDLIETSERRNLATRTDQSRETARSTILTLIFTNLVVLGLLIVTFVLFGRDINERQRRQLELAEARDKLEAAVRERTEQLGITNLELERSNRELQDFAFVASHDLQEPLRKIQAFGDRLRTVQAEKFSDQGRDYLERMQNAASRMHVLINDLLSFSRVTTKAQPFVPTDLNVVASEVLNDLEVRVQQKNAAVTVGDLPTIDADPIQIRQLFQNLIGNALKFHRDGVAPDIRLTAEIIAESANHDINRENDERVCRISISDNGIGFEEKYLDRIFTPFQRLHGRNEFEGTGIGLAICRKIVERHGGELTARSKVGEGTTFILTLPMRAATRSDL